MSPLNNGELAWYRQLGARASAACDGVKQLVSSATPKTGDVRDEPRHWHCFDLADAMEQGLSRALMSSYTEASKSERRMLVQRSQDRREYMLMSEEGDEILLARATDTAARSFDIYIPSGGDPPCALGPAFKVAEEKGKWTMQSLRCDRCESLGRRQCSSPQIFGVKHYKEEVGDGHALCMDVSLPEGHSCGGWCKVCGDPSSAGMEMTSRRPTWNRKIKSLCLDFHGRCSMASSKNIMLDPSGKAGVGETFKLLLGKTGDDTFALHFQEPFGMAQAFGIALSAMHFK